MAENNAKIRISLKDGEFELTGSELFVSQQIDNFRELIVESLKEQKFELRREYEPNLGLPVHNTEQDVREVQQVEEYITLTAKNFPRIFHIDEGKVRIIKRAPGSNNAQKSINTALMYLWAMSSLGHNGVTYPEIRDLCKEQGCLDSSNFSAYMKSARELLVVEGNGKFQKVKLTLPGRERAEEIINELNS